MCNACVRENEMSKRWKKINDGALSSHLEILFIRKISEIESVSSRTGLEECKSASAHGVSTQKRVALVEEWLSALPLVARYISRAEE